MSNLNNDRALFEFTKYFDLDPRNYLGVSYDDTFEGDDYELDLEGFKNKLIKKVKGEKRKKVRTVKEFEHKPVDIEKFLLDPYYLNLGDRLRPSIKEDLLDIFDGKPFEWKYKEIIFNEAIGTGKSYRSALISVFCVYNLLCLYSPSEYFGLDLNTKIMMLNASVNAENARKIVFDYAYNFIINCKWFRDNYAVDDSNSNYLVFDEPPKAKKYDPTRIYKNIWIVPGSSAPTGIAGYAVFLGIIDEATLYVVTDTKDVAEELRRHMRTRIRSRFGDHGMIVMCGSPQYTGDFLQRKIQELQGYSDVKIVQRSIWEAKGFDPADGFFWFDLESYAIYEDEDLVPKHKGKIPERIIKIPNEHYMEFKRTPETAKKDLAGIPLETLTPVFGRNIAVIKKNCNYTRYNPVNEEETDPEYIFDPDFNWFDPATGDLIDEDVIFAIHCDLGLSDCAATMAMAHLMGMTELGEPVARIDFMYRFKPTLKKRFIISTFRNMIYELAERGFPIGSITYDGFQSEDSIQILRNKGFNADKLSVDSSIAPYSLLVEYICDNRLDYPFHPVFIRETEQLEFTANGKKIDHPPMGSKDLSDAVAGALYGLQMFIEELGEDAFPEDYKGDVLYVGRGNYKGFR